MHNWFYVFTCEVVCWVLRSSVRGVLCFVSPASVVFGISKGKGKIPLVLVYRSVVAFGIVLHVYYISTATMLLPFSTRIHVFTAVRGPLGYVCLISSLGLDYAALLSNSSC